MITLGNFVGALMQALSNARTMSDQVSVKIADQYLGHEYLRGFPVPRMTLKQVDVDLTFAVGATSSFSSLLRQPEVVKNIVNRFRGAIQDLPKNESFLTQFGQRTFGDAEWEDEAKNLLDSIEKILANPPAEKLVLNHLLVVACENFFFQIHSLRPQAGLLAGLRRVFGGQEAATERGDFDSQSDGIRNWISEQVTKILDASIPSVVGGADEAPNVQVLVGGHELEGRNPDHLHNIKLSFSSDDRKWVTTEKNGAKTYMLDR